MDGGKEAILVTVAAAPSTAVKHKGSSTTDKYTHNIKGAQLLLCSIAGATTAAGITIGRYMLLETGEVLLLLFSNNDQTVGDNVCGSEDSILLNDVDPDFALQYQCTNNNEQGKIQNVGATILSIASSPYLRAVPLILLVVSSTVFVVGIILTHKQLQQYCSNVQTYHKQLMSIMGVSNQDELIVKLNEKQLDLKKTLGDKVDKTLNCLDGLVLDDVIRKYTKMGIEFTLGVWGGTVLYSLPEEMFANSINDAKATRRRLIHAADPSLEQMLFRPGGVWDVFPPLLRDYLMRRRVVAGIYSGDARLTNGGSIDSHEGTETTTSLGSSEEPNDEDSSDTPVASPVSSLVNATAMGSSIIQNYMPIRVIHAEGQKKKDSSQNKHDGETISDALSATISDLVISNFTGTKISLVEDQSSSNNNEVQSEQREGLQHKGEEQQVTSPPSTFQLDRVLHRTSIVASVAFLYHLRSSSSTRRAWGSVVKVLTSLGLVSTAIGTGVASALLSSTNTKNMASSGDSTTCVTTNHPILTMFYSKVMDQLSVPQTLSLPMDIFKRIQWIREQVCKNKRLQSAVALMVVYGMRRFTKKGIMQSRRVQHR